MISGCNQRSTMVWRMRQAQLSAVRANLHASAVYAGKHDIEVQLVLGLTSFWNQGRNPNAQTCAATWKVVSLPGRGFAPSVWIFSVDELENFPVGRGLSNRVCNSRILLSSVATVYLYVTVPRCCIWLCCIYGTRLRGSFFRESAHLNCFREALMYG